MTTEHLSDRMPDVARGEAEWGIAERGHLERCGECTAEWRVVQLAACARMPVPALDLDRIASGVVRGASASGAVLPFTRRRAVRSWRGWAVGLAAAAAVILAVALWQGSAADPQLAVAPEAGATVLPELDGLADAELEVILASIEIDAAAEEPLGAVPRLGDLTDAELERLLTEVEG
jgi:hypothetical protein